MSKRNWLLKMYFMIFILIVTIAGGLVMAGGESALQVNNNSNSSLSVIMFSGGNKVLERDLAPRSSGQYPISPGSYSLHYYDDNGLERWFDCNIGPDKLYTFNCVHMDGKYGPGANCDHNLGVSALPKAGNPAPSAPSERDAIEAMLKRYSDSVSENDVNRHMSCFAQSVNWFGKEKSWSEIMSIMQKDFGLYTFKSMNVDKFEVSVNGETATALFDKQWTFCNWDKGKGFCGAVRSKYMLIKESGAWKIRGVEDVKVYWSEKGINAKCCDF